MLHFIDKVHGIQANCLLQSVRAGLSNSCYETGSRALGLIDKIVTGLLWRKLRKSSLSILNMGGVYCDMKATFDSWNKDNLCIIVEIAELTGVKGLLHID